MAVSSPDNIALGTPAPAFDLPDVNPLTNRGNISLADLTDAKAVVVIFTCNHCPYARHIEPALIRMAKSYQGRGVEFITICSNDAETYPDDSPEEMARHAQNVGFPFPYLHDATQEVARAYGAVCTPDIYVYDADHKLTYRGRFDETRPKGDDAHGSELAAAVGADLEGRPAIEVQHPAMGCSIKWKP